MYLTPVASKAETKIATATKNIVQRLQSAVTEPSEYLRPDGRNAMISLKVRPKKAATPVYFSPTTPIIEPIAPKNCANEIDFRF